ncbi:MAG: hypothetical protein ACLQGP_19300 [Isosphaeraceae bacterium]
MAKKRSRPPTDVSERLRSILSHTDALAPESESPINHYRLAVNTNFTLIDYIEDHISQGSHSPPIKAKHMGHLRRLVLANLIETFERFIKELASVCIDQLSGFVTDDRYNTFTAKGNEVIAHFEAGSVGKALCESDTWLSNETINNRFRRPLAPFEKDLWDEFLLPSKNQGRGPSKQDQEKRAATLVILWQLRHNLTHNSGVLTGSDSMKLRVVTRRPVEKGRILVPTEEDLRYAKRFFSETADDINSRVGIQLATLLTAAHRESAALVDPQTKADELTDIFSIPLSIADARGKPSDNL